MHVSRPKSADITIQLNWQNIPQKYDLNSTTCDKAKINPMLTTIKYYMYQKTIVKLYEAQLTNQSTWLNTAGQGHTKNQGVKMATKVTKVFIKLAFN